MLRVMLLGSPGAGKGTQAEFIAQRYHIAKIATGDMLRAAIAAATPLGLQAKQFMAKGELVPDDVIIAMVKERIGQADCRHGFLLDGFPRNIAQAEALAAANVQLDYVLDIDVAKDEVLRRLTGRRIHPASGRVYHVSYNPPKVAGKDDITGEDLMQRDDDSEATVLQRLAIYEQQTKPLSDFYRQRAQQARANKDVHGPSYHVINGHAEMAVIRTEISNILNDVNAKTSLAD